MADGVTRDYDDIPGTFVFDGRRARQGYALNAMFMSLNDPANRDRFRADPQSYLDGRGFSEAQRKAVLDRDWLAILELGGNIYFALKLASLDGLTTQDVGAAMTGVSSEEFRQMMRDGGRQPRG